MTASARRHIVLVGLPGAGKTTVGKLVAAALRAPFTDLDEAIERRAGKSVARMFSEDGEATFRALERAEMDLVLGGVPGVIAAGGGWAAQPGNVEAVAGCAVTLYLNVSPEVAARRVSPKALTRPLLAGPDVATRIRELWLARRTFYERCEATVAAEEGTAETVAREVAKLARSLAGWY